MRAVPCTRPRSSGDSAQPALSAQLEPLSLAPLSVLPALPLVSLAAAAANGNAPADDDAALPASAPRGPYGTGAAPCPPAAWAAVPAAAADPTPARSTREAACARGEARAKC